MKREVVSFTVPGTPVGKGRGRVIKLRGRSAIKTPEKTVAYEGLVAHSAHIALDGRPMLQEACSVAMLIVLPIPASWPKRKREDAMVGAVLPTTRPDADNVVKAIFDGCNGVLWRDDVQAVDLVVRKRYGAQPRVDVTVTHAGQGA